MTLVATIFLTLSFSSCFQCDVHGLRLQSKSLKGESHEAEGRREQREALVHRLKDAGDNFSKALDRFGAFVKSWSAKMVTA